MLRIQIASDLHLEWLERNFPDAPALQVHPQADVVVVAGDIHSHTRALPKLRALGVPVVYVAGNHEFYGQQLYGTLDALRSEAPPPVHFLEQRAWLCGRTRFLGVTLWTDYALYGNAVLAQALASRAMADHRWIALNDKVFTAQDALARHQDSLRWLRRELRQPHDGPTVVVTHHGPHPEGVAPQFKGDGLTPAFFSDLRGLMPEVDLWIFGHTHSSVDIQEGRCRVVANPRGYPLNANYAKTEQELVFENRHWKPQWLLELPQGADPSEARALVASASD